MTGHHDKVTIPVPDLELTSWQTDANLADEIDINNVLISITQKSLGSSPQRVGGEFPEDNEDYERFLHRFIARGDIDVPEDFLETGNSDREEGIIYPP